ncbi:uncharacterized protein LOC126714437 [Quercus robur]|uniref:uncharacterized protein LOC126714437 n=1 Tax=Quercus robur TaxID=38942 RepID=UPI002161EE36|nr:uncharacterized protein LOC126714437 [Quercus robur]
MPQTHASNLPPIHTSDPSRPSLMLSTLLTSHLSVPLPPPPSIHAFDLTRLQGSLHFETLQKIMKACIILHIMIVEDEWDDNEMVDLDYEQIDGVDNPLMQVSREQSDGFMAYIESYGCIRDREIHSQLQLDLIEHL